MPKTALVRKAARVIDLKLRNDQAPRLGTAVHYAFGAVGGTTAVLLADRTESPLKAGLTVATAMELGVDQGANTVLRLTAPSWRFPLVTQARAVAAHLVYGVALGLLLAGGRKS